MTCELNLNKAFVVVGVVFQTMTGTFNFMVGTLKFF